MQDVSIYIENPYQRDLQNNLDEARLRIRINSPYSTQRLMEILGNIFRTLQYQLVQVYREVSQICSETWLNWDNGTSFWTRFSEWTRPGSANQDRLNTNRPGPYQHLEHPFQEISLDWEDLRQQFASSRRLTPMRPKINYRTFAQAADVFKASTKDVKNLVDCDCGICLEELKPNRMWARLPCGHVFHSTCAKRWVCKHSNQPSCPSCRAPVALK